MVSNHQMVPVTNRFPRATSQNLQAYRESPLFPPRQPGLGRQVLPLDQCICSLGPIAGRFLPALVDGFGERESHSQREGFKIPQGEANLRHEEDSPLCSAQVLMGPAEVMQSGSSVRWPRRLACEPGGDIQFSDSQELLVKSSQALS